MQIRMYCQQQLSVLIFKENIVHKNIFFKSNMEILLCAPEEKIDKADLWTEFLWNDELNIFPLNKQLTPKIDSMIFFVLFWYCSEKEYQKKSKRTEKLDIWQLVSETITSISSIEIVLIIFLFLNWFGPLYYYRRWFKKTCSGWI